MKKHFTKLGHKPKGTMNKTEALYAEKLFHLKDMNLIKNYGYEKITLRLGYRCSYTPDFYYITNEDQLVLIEIKGGFITDKGMVKFKVACEQYPFIKFMMIQYEEKEWNVIREN